MTTARVVGTCKLHDNCHLQVDLYGDLSFHSEVFPLCDLVCFHSAAINVMLTTLVQADDR